MAGTKPFDKFFSKPDFWGPNDLFPPGKPSIEVGGRSLPPQLMGFPEGRGRLDPKSHVLRENAKRVGAADLNGWSTPLLFVMIGNLCSATSGASTLVSIILGVPAPPGPPNIDEAQARLPSSTQTRPWFSRCPAVPGSRCAPSSKQLRAMQLCLQSREQGTVFISCALGSSPTPCDRRLQTPNKHAL